MSDQEFATKHNGHQVEGFYERIIGHAVEFVDGEAVLGDQFTNDLDSGLEVICVDCLERTNWAGNWKFE